MRTVAGGGSGERERELALGACAQRCPPPPRGGLRCGGPEGSGRREGLERLSPQLVGAVSAFSCRFFLLC